MKYAGQAYCKTSLNEYIRLRDTSNRILDQVTQVVDGDYMTCVLRLGNVYCLGLNGGEYSENAKKILKSDGTALNNVIKIDTFGDHACALTSGAMGKLWCWGYNGSGQLGTNETSERPWALDVKLDNIKMFSTGNLKTCASDGNSVWCWGVDYGSPYTTFELPGIELLSAGYYSFQACAIASGKVYCWNNGAGTYSPIAVLTVDGELSNVTEIRAGVDHVCALANGVVYCWGSNNVGHLGVGSQQGTTSFAIPITSLPPIKALTGGFDSHCAYDGTNVWCWGHMPFNHPDQSWEVYWTPVVMTTNGIIAQKSRLTLLSPTPSRTLTDTPIPTDTRTPSPIPTATTYPYWNAVRNPSFEQGSAYWSQWSLKGESIIFTDGEFAYSNKGYVHLGDYSNRRGEQHKLWQTIKVPPYHTTLSFWMRFYSYEQTFINDRYWVSVNGNILQRYWICCGGTDWERYEVDLSAYAGQTVKIEFGMITDSNSNASNLFLDDVQFE
jgi:hypothetical protein